jgi:hypothetical protein
MKRARRRLRKNANPQSRLSATAFELASTALLNRNAIDEASDQFARSKMRLDEGEQLD